MAEDLKLRVRSSPLIPQPSDAADEGMVIKKVTAAVTMKTAAVMTMKANGDGDKEEDGGHEEARATWGSGGLNSSHAGSTSAIGIGRLHRSGLFFWGEPVSCSTLSGTAPLTRMITRP